MTDIITSTSNQKIKQIRKLTERRERTASGLFFAEGLRIIIEAVQQQADIEHLIVSPDLVRSETGEEWIQTFLQRNPEKVFFVTPEVFRSLSQKDGPQGVAAVIQQRWLEISDLQLRPGDCWVALDEVADPGNLGTIMRTVDGVGAKGVILLDQCTDPYDPTALRGSMGAVFSIQLVKATFAQFETWKKQNNMAIIGTSDRGKGDYHQIKYPDPVVLLMGSERQGLDQKHFDLCTEVAAIPMRGRSDSLNLAVATGIMLYEIDHQWRAGLSAGGR